MNQNCVLLQHTTAFALSVRAVALLLTATVLFGGCSGNDPGIPSYSSSCNAATRDLVAHMYACAFSYPDDFAVQLMTKPGYATETGWQKCAMYLVQRLRAEARELAPSHAYTDAAARIGSNYGGFMAGLSLDVINDANSASTPLQLAAAQIEYITATTRAALSDQLSPYQSPFPVPAEYWRLLYRTYNPQVVNEERFRLYQYNYQWIQGLYHVASMSE